MKSWTDENGTVHVEVESLEEAALAILDKFGENK